MRIRIFAFLLLGLMASCGKKEKETLSGLKFEVLSEGDGTLAEPGQILVFNLRVVDATDSVWGDTYERGYPNFMQASDTATIKTQDGLVQAINMCSKGDSIVATVSVEEIYTKYAHQPVPEGMDPKSTVSYTISVSDIIDQANYEEYSKGIYTAWEEKQRVIEEEKAKVQLPKDIEVIDAYLKEKGIDAVKLESGLRYVVEKEGEGPKATSGQQASVDYEGYLLDGTIFDTCVESIAKERGIYDPNRAARFPYQPLSVTVDETSVIKGWHLAIKEMNKGMKATFYVPSTLAYGPNRRSDKIGENEILVFKLDLVDLQ